MSGAAIALIVLGVVAVLGFGGCLVCVGGAAIVGSSHDASVSCTRSSFGSATCTIIHTRGSGPAEICWNMKVACSSGVVSQGQACETVAEKGFSSKFVPSSAFSNSVLCGSGLMSVENVTAKGR